MNIEDRRESAAMEPDDPVSPADIPGWGADRRPEDRPGVPKEASPHPLPGTHWQEPPRQVPMVPVLKRADLPALTPVFGTAEPPHGLSGKIRRAAYRITDDKGSHWALLLFADRVDALESSLGRALRRIPAALSMGAAVVWYVRKRRSQRRWQRG